MNLELEVKAVLRSQQTPKKMTRDICVFTNFKKEKIMKAINKGGKNSSEIYGHILELHKKERRQT